MNKIKPYLIISAIYFLILFLLNYFLLLVLNIRYFEIAFCFLLYIFIIILFKIYRSYKVEQTKTKKKKQYYDDQQLSFLISETAKRHYKYLGAIILFLVLIYGFISSKMFNAKSYQQMITVSESGNFASDFEKVDINKLPIIDHQFAKRLGDKVLGQKFVNANGVTVNYGSEFEVIEFFDISYLGEPYLVAPLSHRDFFKWNNNKDGSPGYILVNKITGEAKLVTTFNQEDVKMKYMPSAFFSYDLHRHLYKNGFKYNQLDRFFFEIDESGTPYFIAIETKYTIKINGGKDVNRVILVNAITGEINPYTPKNTPTWVDNIYPKDLVIEQLDNWGTLKSGYINSIFAQRGVMTTTEGSRRIYDDSQLYHYTGLTSVGSDESSTGFVYVNTRTKDANYYSIVGATEQAGMKSAEGQVRNFEGYEATFPISLNVNNQPTFFITIKDSNGIIQQYAFVNITQYTKVGVGKTITSAYNSYLKALGDEGEITDEEDLIQKEGKVERISWNIIDGQTIYYIKLYGDATIYSVRYTISDELPITIVGDDITIKVTGNIIKYFKNNDL